MLLCMSLLKSAIVVRYRVLKSSGKVKAKDDDDVVLKGGAANVRSHSVSKCLEFAAHFVAAFICIMFVSQDLLRNVLLVSFAS
jgi:hypothetical protein